MVMDKVKNALMDAAVLAHPDYTKPFILYTDASKTGLGAALHQTDEDGIEHPLAFYSKKLTGAPTRYPPIELEAMAVIFGLDKSKSITQGCDVIVRTDHRPLQYIADPSRQSKNSRFARWAAEMNGTQVYYQPGSS